MRQQTLKRDISRSSILLAAAGGMIGSGWLFSPLYAAQIAGPGALIAWCGAALFMMLVALTLCELGAVYPISGGMSNYPKFTHGALIGFIYSWIAWLSYVVMTPIEVQAVLQYASIFFPSLMVKSNGMMELTTQGYLWAFILLVVISYLNTFGIKAIAESNKYISIWKIVVPSLAIVAFFMSAHSLKNIEGYQIRSAENWHHIFSALSLGGIAFAFTGFQNGLVMAGEVKNPQKNIPISIIGAVAVGFLLYFLLQLSFILALPQETLSGGFKNLSFTGEAGPLVGLSTLLGLALITKLLLVDAVISPLGTALVYTTATSRILYGMAENGFLPKKLLTLNKNKIPYVTLIINFIFGLFSFLPFPGWQKMVGFLSSVSILSYGIGAICLLALRKQQPNLHRPFKLPYHQLISHCAFIVCNLMLYWCGWDIIWKLYVAVWVGGALYYFSGNQEHFRSLLKNSIWFLAYLHFIFFISYAGNFAGKGLLASPYDVLSIIIMSVVVLIWSTKSAEGSMPVSGRTEIYSERKEPEPVASSADF